MSDAFSLINALEQEPELALLVAQPPVAFERYFVDITGSTMSALLLSAYRDLRALPDGWLELDVGEIEYRTGLTRSEQKVGKKLLLDRQLIRERDGQIQIDFERIAREITAVARKRNHVPLAALGDGSGRLMPTLPTRWIGAH